MAQTIQAIQTIHTTTYKRCFPVLHSSMIDLDILTRTQLLNYLCACVHAAGIKSHKSNWNLSCKDELLFLVSSFQSRGAPPLTLESISSHDSARTMVLASMLMLMRMQTKTQPRTRSHNDSYIPPHIIIAPSSIPNAKLGAFAAQDLKSGLVLGEYDGKHILNEKEAKHTAENLENPYVFCVYNLDSADREFLVAKDSSRLYPEVNKNTGRVLNCQGTWPRFINEGDAQTCNVCYSLDFKECRSKRETKLKAKKTNRDNYLLENKRHCILVSTLRFIRKGEELLVQYNDVTK
jgi:hypothetical protein